nr:hypothetical protein [Tanacetum cinerariifolium]
MPLSTIDPKDKEKGVLEEPESAKKMTKSDFDAAHIARDEEISRQLEVELQAEVERERQREEQASMNYIANLYDEVQVRIDADHERKKQLTEERAATIRNKPPTKTQLRRLMMTYLKNIDFVPIGSEEDERMIRDINKKAEEESNNKDPNNEGIIDYEVLDKRFPIINWESNFYHYDRHGANGFYYRIFKSDGSSRWVKTFSEMVTRFDRLDLMELYNLVMQIFEKTTPEGVDLILWGDLRTMFEANAEDELWQNQEEWSLKSWNFYENCGVHILVLKDGTKIHMLAERRYPLTTMTLKRMLSLKLIAESASDAAYDLLRFIQKQIDEFRGNDRGEKDL